MRLNTAGSPQCASHLAQALLQPASLQPARFIKCCLCGNSFAQNHIKSIYIVHYDVTSWLPEFLFRWWASPLLGVQEERQGVDSQRVWKLRQLSEWETLTLSQIVCKIQRFEIL